MYILQAGSHILRNMARRIAIKDGSTIYFANRIGVDTQGIGVYNGTTECTAYVADYSGSSPNSRFGSDNNYSLQIILQDCEDTKYINQYTKFWIYEFPRASSDPCDYMPISEPIHRDGQLLVSLNSVQVNYSDLYYAYNNRVIIFTAADYLENNKFYIKNNTYLPVAIGDTMWYLEPVNASDTNNTMTVTNITQYDKYVEYEVAIDGAN